MTPGGGWDGGPSEGAEWGAGQSQANPLAAAYPREWLPQLPAGPNLAGLPHMPPPADAMAQTYAALMGGAGVAPPGLQAHMNGGSLAGGLPHSAAHPAVPAAGGGAPGGAGPAGVQIELQQSSGGGGAASRWKAASAKAQALGLLRRAGAGQAEPQSSVVALLRADPSWESFYEVARGFIQAADVEGRGYIRHDDLSSALQVVWRAKGGGEGAQAACAVLNGALGDGVMVHRPNLTAEALVLHVSSNGAPAPWGLGQLADALAEAGQILSSNSNHSFSSGRLLGPGLSLLGLTASCAVTYTLFAPALREGGASCSRAGASLADLMEAEHGERWLVHLVWLGPALTLLGALATVLVGRGPPVLDPNAGIPRTVAGVGSADPGGGGGPQEGSAGGQAWWDLQSAGAAGLPLSVPGLRRAMLLGTLVSGLALQCVLAGTVYDSDGHFSRDFTSSSVLIGTLAVVTVTGVTHSVFRALPPGPAFELDRARDFIALAGLEVFVPHHPELQTAAHIWGLLRDHTMAAHRAWTPLQFLGLFSVALASIPWAMGLISEGSCWGKNLLDFALVAPLCTLALWLACSAFIMDCAEIRGIHVARMRMQQAIGNTTSRASAMRFKVPHLPLGQRANLHAFILLREFAQAHFLVGDAAYVGGRGVGWGVAVLSVLSLVLAPLNALAVAQRWKFCAVMCLGFGLLSNMLTFGAGGLGSLGAVLKTRRQQLMHASKLEVMGVKLKLRSGAASAAEAAALEGDFEGAGTVGEAVKTIRMASSACSAMDGFQPQLLGVTLSDVSVLTLRVFALIVFIGGVLAAGMTW